jgi:undecaprenyl-diphosphatase
MRSPIDGLTAGQALALGALHGPAELLPVSSSAHTTVVPWLFGWRYSELDPELRKSFEVALHAGTAAAIVLTLRFQRWNRRRLLVLMLSAVPPAIAGYAFEHEIERSLGTPGTIAGALLAGSVAMTLADRSPQDRASDEAGVRDGLWLGIAQACALVPGVSRAGATLAAARFLRFRAKDALLLSDEAALPVLAGATLLKAARLRHLSSRRATLGLGAGAAFASTLACSGPARRAARAERLWPYAVYRILLATLILVRQRRDPTAVPQGRLGTEAPLALELP